MKKKVLFIMLLLLSIVGTTRATGIKIPIQQVSVSGKRNNQKGGIRHAPPAPTKQPIAILEENCITITAISNDANLNLVLYDEDGNIIYNVTNTATSSTWTFNIPNDIIGNATSLRLTVNDKMYIGEF